MSYTEFGKLEDGQLVYAKKHMIVGEVGVLYPSDALLRELGYKYVNMDQPEEEPPEGWHWEDGVFEETDDEIRLQYELVRDPQPSDDDELDPSEIAEILLGGAPTWTGEET